MRNQLRVHVRSMYVLVVGAHILNLMQQASR
jgi:hypothetical protein